MNRIIIAAIIIAIAAVIFGVYFKLGLHNRKNNSMPVSLDSAPPTEVYFAMHRAIDGAKNLDEYIAVIDKYVSQDGQQGGFSVQEIDALAKEPNDKKAQDFAFFQQLIVPTNNLRVVNEKIDGDTVILDTEDVSNNGTGKATMKLEAGVWKLESEWSPSPT